MTSSRTLASSSLQPGGAELSASEPGSPKAEPVAAVAARLLAAVETSRIQLLYVAGGERRAEELARALDAFAAGAVQVVLLPPWDCLPYDRASPSREIMGKRMAALLELSERATDRACSSPRRKLSSSGSLRRRRWRVPPSPCAWAKCWTGRRWPPSHDARATPRTTGRTNPENSSSWARSSTSSRLSATNPYAPSSTPKAASPTSTPTIRSPNAPPLLFGSSRLVRLQN